MTAKKTKKTTKKTETAKAPKPPQGFTIEEHEQAIAARRDRIAQARKGAKE